MSKDKPKYNVWRANSGSIAVVKMNEVHIRNVIKYLQNKRDCNYYETIEEIRWANGWINHLKNVLQTRMACYKDKSLNINLFSNNSVNQ